MPQIGPLEILVVSAIALIVFGPEKLPEIARSIGRAAAELRRVASDAKAEFESGLNDDDDDDGDERVAAEKSGPAAPAAAGQPDLEED